MLIPIAFALTSLVTGETCPAAEAVERRVRAILHLSDEQRLGESFIVERREAGMFVELRSADSTSIGERLLPTEGSCDELAQAAAVVLSAWLTDVHPDFAPVLPLRDAIELPPPPPAPAPPTPPKVEPPKPLEVRAREPRVSSASTTSPRHLELDLGVGVGMADDGEPAGVGALGAAYIPPRGWGARATAWVDTSRRAALGSGTVSWRRWPIALGPSWRYRSDALAFDLTLAPALSWLRVSGIGFEPTKAQNGLTWAGTFDARLASNRRAGWFVAVHGQAYFADSSAYAGKAEYVLPRFVFSILVGARVAP